MIPPESISRHERSKQLLFGALDLSPEVRDAFLAQACAEDQELERDVQSLLAEFTQLDGFLEGTAGALVAELDSRAALPDHLGPYRILRLLGRGGMGLVYLAEQPSPRRRVALKVLRLDAATEAARARFAREAEVLARCQHPGIAQIHAASVVETDVGPQPVICMEYVDGKPIVEHARIAKLDRSARVELILQVADAMAHAHAQGVLHRDLKPDNVLVDGAGRARILDFGIAHVVGDEGDFVTRTGQVLGTVAYMSPEQARGGRVDERSDLFSLGVMLYELLTDRLPFETRGALMHAALRTLAEGDATPLSRHDASLRGDLETILAKALASEPARRYRSVAGFAADLRAFEAGRPISARPPSALYVLSKFARRHWAMSLAVVVASVALGVVAAVALQALTRVDAQVGYTELFADRNLLDELESEADVLWPADSTQLAALDDWLVRARDVTSRLGEHRQRVAALEATGGISAQGAAVDPAWLLGEGRALVSELTTFAGPNGLQAELRERHRWAAQLRAQSVDPYAAEWRAAAEAILADPRFEGLELLPQEGLIPLGADPRSGLQEFAHLGLSGELPVRDPSRGELSAGPGTGLVFVLVPGGRVSIGDPAAPFNGAGLVERDGEQVKVMLNEGPAIEMQLDPYMISKYELTQGQFLRAFGFNPSDHGIGDEWSGKVAGPSNPVESVSWDQARFLLGQLGLDLPTEAQWEAAARAGTTGRYILGDSPAATVGFANLRQDLVTSVAEASGLEEDGFYSHAPVGTFASNPYGLHDVIGNVWELCRDTYKVRYHELGHRAGDGLVLAEPDGDVSRRGVAWGAGPGMATVFTRQYMLQGMPGATTGVRPVWSLRAAPME